MQRPVPITVLAVLYRALCRGFKVGKSKHIGQKPLLAVVDPRNCKDMHFPELCEKDMPVPLKGMEDKTVGGQADAVLPEPGKILLFDADAIPDFSIGKGLHVGEIYPHPLPRILSRVNGGRCRGGRGRKLVGIWPAVLHSVLGMGRCVLSCVFIEPGAGIL